MDATIARFTSLGKAEAVFNAFVEYFKEEQAPALSIVNFKDCTIKINSDGTTEKIKKSPEKQRVLPHRHGIEVQTV